MTPRYGGWGIGIKGWLFRLTAMTGCGYNKTANNPKGILKLKKVFQVETLLAVALLTSLAIFVMEWSFVFRSSYLPLNDFTAFYLSGRIFRSGQAWQMYNPVVQKEILLEVLANQTHATFDELPQLPQHVYFLAPVFGLIAVDNLQLSFALWSVISLALLLLCAWLAYRMLSQAGWNKTNAILAGCSLICFYPVYLIVIKGQDISILLLGMLLGLEGLLRRQEQKAGLGFTLAWITPQITGLFAPMLLASKRKVFLWFCLGSLLLFIYALILFGTTGILTFLSQLLNISQGADYSNNQVVMVNFLGLLRRLFPQAAPGVVSLLSWGSLLLTVAVLSWIWWRDGYRLCSKTIGLSILIILFMAPHLHYHSLSLLFLPWICMALGAESKGQQLTALTLPIFGSLAMMLSDLSPDPWRFIIVYLIMGLLAIGLLRMPGTARPG